MGIRNAMITRSTPTPKPKSRAAQTMLDLVIYNSRRRGDKTAEILSHAEIGATIDSAVDLLRKHDGLEREVTQLRDALESLAYWSRSRTETRISLRTRIAKIMETKL